MPDTSKHQPYAVSTHPVVNCNPTSATSGHQLSCLYTELSISSIVYVQYHLYPVSSISRIVYIQNRLYPESSTSRITYSSPIYLDATTNLTCSKHDFYADFVTFVSMVHMEFTPSVKCEVNNSGL